MNHSYVVFVDRKTKANAQQRINLIKLSLPILQKTPPQNTPKPSGIRYICGAAHMPSFSDLVFIGLICNHDSRSMNKLRRRVKSAFGLEKYFCRCVKAKKGKQRSDSKNLRKGDSMINRIFHKGLSFSF
jgi:hypothetical protein